MHSYHNKLLPNHLWVFYSISSIHSHSTRLTTSNNLFLPRINSSSGQCSLYLFWPKCGFQYQAISLQPRLPFKWKLKKHLLHEKVTQLWTFATLHLSRTKFCEFKYFVILCIFYVYLLSAFFHPCAHPILFSMKAHFIVFSVLLCFFFCLARGPLWRAINLARGPPWEGRV